MVNGEEKNKKGVAKRVKGVLPQDDG